MLLGGMCLALAGPPARFVSRGPGGGGAFFGPSISTNVMFTYQVTVGETSAAPIRSFLAEVR